MRRKLLTPMLSLILVLGLILPVATPVMAAPAYAELRAGNGAFIMGHIMITEDADYIHVTYVSWGYWLLTETSVAIGESIEDIPQNGKGNPKVGHFPYSDPHGPVYTYTYDIERDPSWVAGTELCIATHAVVYEPLLEQEETAWSLISCDVHEFGGRSWATYFYYTIQGN
jgi:hypothetical protein